MAEALVGKPAPDFDMPSTKNIEKLNENVQLDDYKGRWLVLLFYPLDFTFVCPTELTSFSDRYEDFEGIGAAVVGVSTDSVHSHRAWLKTPRDKGGVEGLRYPLASDITKSVARDYGVLIEDKGVALRGLFVIDPEGTLRYAVIHDLNVGVGLVARHVHGDDAQAVGRAAVAPLRDARQVLLTHPAAHRPEVDERRVPLRPGLGGRPRRVEPLGRPLQRRHLRPDSHWHDDTPVKSDE